MKEALRTADEWFRAASDASLDALFIAKGVRDEAGQLVDFECIDVNGTALTMLGIARKEVIGQKLWGLLPVKRETFFDKYAQVLATGVPLEEEFAIDMPEAEAKWLRHQMVRVGDGIAISIRDVTHWKESGARLKESEERLRMATEAAHMGAWTWDPKTDRVSFSEGIGPVFGLPRGEGFHTLVEMIKAVYPADRDIVARAMLSGRETGTSARMEVRTLWPDGTLHWVESESNFIRDATGAVERGVGIAMDITERKQADEALLKSEKNLNEAQRLAKIGSWDWDIATDTITWSKEYYRIYGIDPSQRPPGYEDHLKAYTPESAARLDEAVKRNTQTGEPYELDLELARTEGPRRWITARSETKRDSQGQITGLRGTALDITEPKQAGEALARESYRNQVFLRNASDGVHILDTDGNVLQVSDSFCQMLGYSREELIGANVSLWDAQWSPQELKQKIAELIAKGGRSVFETRHRRRDGSLLDVEINLQPLELDDKPVLFNSARDITERKRATAEIQRYIEQLKNAFMSTVEVTTTLSEMRDPYTAGHERRVGKIAAAIGAELGLDEQRVEGLRVAGYLHDIGKISIPAEILSKPGKLSAIEFKLIQGHSQAGYDVLKEVKFPWPVAQVTLQHHERLDGSGYPQGLKGEAILLEARILAVADVIEAMSTHRPYRPGLGIEAALTEIERGSGIVYDATVADACLKLFREKGYAIPG